MQEIDACMRCKKPLRVDYDDFQPVQIPGHGEMCADCYNALSTQEKSAYFHRV